MKRNLIPVVLLAASAPVWGQPGRHQGELEVTAVRLWSLTGVARAVIQVSGEFEYRSERAHNPERIFFDISRSRPNFEGHRLFRKETDDPIVRRIRVAETTPGVTRVVLELGGESEFTASQLANPDRLIVELRAPLAARPAITESRPPTPVLNAVESTPVSASLPARPLAGAAVERAMRPGTAEAAPMLPSPPGDAVPAGATLAKAVPPKIAPLRPEVPLPDRAKTETAKLETKAIPVTQEIPSGLKGLETAADVNSRPEVGKAAKLAGNNSLIRVLGLKINRVVIDPGHGGHDEGTRGGHGLLEKDLVLDISQRLGKLIEQRMGAEVIYTRADDTFIPLQQRTALANEKKADLFLSIHANSSRYPRIAGVESYYLNFADSQDAEAMDVASRENAASSSSVFELGDLVQKITRHEKVEESKEFASNVQNALQAFELRSFPQSKQRGVKRAPFVVLIGAQMPSVLTEVGFLTNPREEALLKRPEYRQRVAEAIFRGISRYAQNLSHFQVASAGAD